MRDRGRGGDGGRDWGSIDWSNIDLSGFGRGGTRISGPSRRVVFFAIIVLLLLLIPLLFGPFVAFLTDLLWFRSLGLESVYLRRFTAGFYAFAVFGALFFVLALPNLYFALRPQVPRVVVDAERRRRGALPTTLRFMWLLLIPAFFFGLAGGDEWDMLLRWVNQVPFGATDPVFGRDIGFYFFTLPVLEFVRGWLLVALIVIAIGVVTLYFTRGVIGVATGTLASADMRFAARSGSSAARSSSGSRRASWSGACIRRSSRTSSLLRTSRTKSGPISSGTSPRRARRIPSTRSTKARSASPTRPRRRRLARR